MSSRYWKTVAISVIRAGSVKLWRYRTVEQVLENCRNIGHFSEYFETVIVHNELTVL